MTEHLEFAPEILRRLGEELVPHADQGIIELVRNAYDADATTCSVELVGTTKPGGKVVVTDNGDGIPRQSITSGWLVLGRSSKRRSATTANQRVPAGDKGLGRLAGLRLGKSATLKTRPKSEPGTEYVVTLNWDEFDRASVIGDVPIEVVKKATKTKPGTTIELIDLRHKFTRANVTRLARALVLLSDPFQHDQGFKTTLLVPEFEDLQARVRASYFDDVDYRISARIDTEGRASAQVLDYRGAVRFSAEHDRIAKKRKGAPYATSPATFELWAYNMSASGFAATAATVSEVSKWIKVVGGVHVYQHNLRVPPYGDSGEDWLDLNLRRARSPEFRPSTNTSVGRVVLTSQDDLLVQKTDRSGFIANEAFWELRSACQDVLDWSGSEQLRVANAKRREEKKKAEAAMAPVKKDEVLVEETLEDTAPEAAAAFKRYQKARERQEAALKEDILLYRTLGTVGTTSAAFAHESVKPASRIEQTVRLTRRAGSKQFGDEFVEGLGGHLDIIAKAAKALGKWSQLPLTLLKRSKRRSRRVDLRESLDDVVDLLAPFVDDAGIELVVRKCDDEVAVFGPPAALEAIVANLLVNSINAVVRSKKSDRQIELRVDMAEDGHFGVLEVADTGLGVTGIAVEEIWLPGRSSQDEGTGLGLTIVQDSVSDLGGSVELIEVGHLGGASFVVRVPVLEAT